MSFKQNLKDDLREIPHGLAHYAIHKAIEAVGPVAIVAAPVVVPVALWIGINLWWGKKCEENGWDPFFD